MRSSPFRVGGLLQQTNKLLPLQRFSSAFDSPYIAKGCERNRPSRNLGKKVSRHTGSKETQTTFVVRILAVSAKNGQYRSYVVSE